MKALPLLLAVLLAWLAVASGYHLMDYPHFLGGGGPAPSLLPPGGGCCTPMSLIDFLVRFVGVLLICSVPTAVLLIPLAAWGWWQRRRGAYPAYGRGLGDNRDLWLAG